VGAHEIDGKTFVFLGHPLHAAETEIQSVQERNRENQGKAGSRVFCLGGWWAGWSIACSAYPDFPSD
jgi:Mn2+/Fe2+ NRAMP family transporter